MSQIGLTSLVTTDPNYAKQLGIPSTYYRYRSCSPNFPNRTQTSVSGFTPAEQYQKLKLIQNTVRIYGSLYTANLGPLTAYKRPINNPTDGLYGVCWNQMSDRPVPSVQKATVPTGYNVSTLNRRNTSVTSSRPGCQTPGGIGCDIKHNSYDRYLNRLKGKTSLRRGPIPNNFGVPIPFNPAVPIYGGKTIKTNIINGCNCPMNDTDEKVFENPNLQAYPTSKCGFSIGTYVYAIQEGTDFYTRAQIIYKTEEDIYTIQFDNGTIQTVTNPCDLLIYFPCDCDTPTQVLTLNKGLVNIIGSENCTVPVSLFNSLKV